MINQVTSNTFTQGIIKDFHPIRTPNNCLTDALNATVLTYNGNELMLQNDLGNGRVETAYLPEGFIPLGTCSIGGIIYVVSYNPQSGVGLIGSFPSPERNIEQEGITFTKSISFKSFFGEDEKIKINTETFTIKNIIKQFLQILLSETTLNPGDLYLITGNVKDIGDAVSSYGFSDIFSNPELFRLKIIYISDLNSKIDVTESQKKYEEKFFIKESNGEEIENIKDIDQYRTIISSPYNCVSGNLAITLGMEAVVDTISLFVTSYTVLPTSDPNRYQLYFLVNWEVDREKYKELVNIQNVLISTDDKNGPLYNLVSLGNGSNIYRKTIPVVKIENGQYKITQGDTTELRKNDGSDPFTLIGPISVAKDDILSYRVLPLIKDPAEDKKFLNILYLQLEGEIDIDKLTSEFVTLNSWKYYVTNTSQSSAGQVAINYRVTTNMAGIPISKIGMEFYQATSNALYISDNGQKISINDVEKLIKTSDINTYEDPIYIHPIEFENSSLTAGGIITLPLDQLLKDNSLYFVKINVYTEESSTPIIVFKRFLYTTPQFNSDYNTESDFDNLRITSKRLGEDIKVDFRTSPPEIDMEGLVLYSKNDPGVTELDISANAKETLRIILEISLEENCGELFSVNINNNQDGIDIKAVECSFNEISDFNNENLSIVNKFENNTITSLLVNNLSWKYNNIECRYVQKETFFKYFYTPLITGNQQLDADTDITNIEGNLQKYLNTYLSLETTPKMYNLIFTGPVPVAYDANGFPVFNTSMLCLKSKNITGNVTIDDFTLTDAPKYKHLAGFSGGGKEYDGFFKEQFESQIYPISGMSNIKDLFKNLGAYDEEKLNSVMLVDYVPVIYMRDKLEYKKSSTGELVDMSTQVRSNATDGYPNANYIFPLNDREETANASPPYQLLYLVRNKGNTPILMYGLCGIDEQKVPYPFGQLYKVIKNPSSQLSVLAYMLDHLDLPTNSNGVTTYKIESSIERTIKAGNIILRNNLPPNLQSDDFEKTSRSLEVETPLVISSISDYLCLKKSKVEVISKVSEVSYTHKSADNTYSKTCSFEYCYYREEDSNDGKMMSTLYADASRYGLSDSFEPIQALVGLDESTIEYTIQSGSVVIDIPSLGNLTATFNKSEDFNETLFLTAKIGNTLCEFITLGGVDFGNSGNLSRRSMFILVVTRKNSYVNTYEGS